MNSSLFLIAIFSFLAVASASRVFLERKTPLEQPRGWEWVRHAEGDATVALTVALTQRNLKEFKQVFEAVSTPGNPRYAQYLSSEEIADLIAPEKEAIDTVVAWLLTSGVTSYKLASTRDLISFEAPVSVVESMLGCQFQVFEHQHHERMAISSHGPYSVPAHIARYVDLVAGVTGFPALPHEKRSDASLAVNDPAIAPADLRNAYNVPAGTVGTQSNNKQAVAEFQYQYYSPTDLDQFFEQYVPYSSASKVAEVVGTNSAALPGVEASLDIEYIMGVAPSVPTYFYYQGGSFWNALLNWAQVLLDETAPPQVHSVSYGDQAVIGQPSNDLKNRLNTEFEKLGTEGLTIIFASGDSGAGCYLCSKVEPSFPATAPAVLSVGATRFSDGVIGNPEDAVTQFGSGGGFSNTFSRPSYQSSAVSGYLSNPGNDLPPASSFNATGRGTPDVAALGVGFQVVVKEKTEIVGGTSASAPTVAGIIALVNDHLLANGKNPMGFVNPLFYQNADIFTSVNTGDNDHLCCQGFKCAQGWDPVTGLGTLDFQKLLQVALSAQA